MELVKESWHSLEALVDKLKSGLLDQMKDKPRIGNMIHKMEKSLLLLVLDATGVLKSTTQQPLPKGILKLSLALLLVSCIKIQMLHLIQPMSRFAEATQVMSRLLILSMIVPRLPTRSWSSSSILSMILLP